MAFDTCPLKEGGTCTGSNCEFWCGLKSSCVFICQLVESREYWEKSLADFKNIYKELQDIAKSCKEIEKNTKP